MKKRIWEIDFLRGILIIAVVFDHFMFDWLDLPYYAYNYTILPEWMKNLHVFARFYWTNQARFIIRAIALGLFFLLSGISSSFSRNNLKRGIKLLIFSFIISLTTIILYHITKALTFIQTVDVRIYIGAITCFAATIIIYGLLNKLFDKFNLSIRFKNYFFLVTGLSIILFSSLWGLYPQEYLNELYVWNTKSFFEFIFGKLAYGNGDYFGLFPFLGYIFIGGFLGQTLYKDKKSKIEKFENNRFIKDISIIGRKTLYIYLLHQVVLFPIVILILYLGGARF